MQALRYLAILQRTTLRFADSPTHFLWEDCPSCYPKLGMNGELVDRFLSENSLGGVPCHFSCEDLLQVLLLVVSCTIEISR